MLNGLTDTFEPAPSDEGDIGTVEQRTALVDFLEFYLFSYFKAGTGEQTPLDSHGRKLFEETGCTTCHIPTADPARSAGGRRGDRVRPRAGPFQPALFHRALIAREPVIDRAGRGREDSAYQPFVVENIYTDFKRHDLGPNFHERSYDGTIRTAFMTSPLWGVGSTPPYGHDGRSINLMEVILRHGGEAKEARDSFAALSSTEP